MLTLSSLMSHSYHELLNRTYVDDNPSLKWCPAPGCASCLFPPFFGGGGGGLKLIITPLPIRHLRCRMQAGRTQGPQYHYPDRHVRMRADVLLRVRPSALAI